jgi:hypothetical protein
MITRKAYTKSECLFQEGMLSKEISDIEDYKRGRRKYQNCLSKKN